MISIIVSSYKPEYFKQFEINVRETVGVPYEIIQINNPGLMGLCEAYNTGSGKAKYKVLCFCHEDILIRTFNWGNIVLDMFADKTIGLIGVAGSKYKTYIPSGWAYPTSESVCMNIIQGNKNSEVPSYLVYANRQQEERSEVVAVDGVWFCTKSSIVKEMPFDAEGFKGFHCYDVDFSLQVFGKYKIIVTYDILIEHFSGGSFDEGWIKDTMLLHNKWKKLLPISVTSKSNKFIHTEEAGAFNYLIKKIKQTKTSSHQLLSFLWSDFFKSIKITGAKNYLKMNVKAILPSFFYN